MQLPVPNDLLFDACPRFDGKSTNNKINVLIRYDIQFGNGHSFSLHQAHFRDTPGHITGGSGRGPQLGV